MDRWTGGQVCSTWDDVMKMCRYERIRWSDGGGGVLCG